jgi:hypothetical protein
VAALLHGTPLPDLLAWIGLALWRYDAVRNDGFLGAVASSSVSTAPSGGEDPRSPMGRHDKATGLRPQSATHAGHGECLAWSIFAPAG